MDSASPPVQSDADQVNARLFPVAVALMSVSILGVFGNLFGLTFVWRTLSEAEPAAGGWQPRDFALFHLASLGWCLGLIGAAVILSRTWSFPVAVAMCCLALVPFIGPLLFLGVPIGVWGLITLWSSRVRASFNQTVGASSPIRLILPTSGARQQAQAKLFPIGLLLAITSAIGLVADGVGMLIVLTAAMKLSGLDLRHQLWWSMTLGIHALYVMLLLAGGITLLRGKARLFSTSTAWLACVPVLSPCFIFSIPIGFWALWTLRSLSTTAAFASHVTDDRAAWFTRRVSTEISPELSASPDPSPP